MISFYNNNFLYNNDFFIDYNNYYFISNIFLHQFLIFTDGICYLTSITTAFIYSFIDIEEIYNNLKDKNKTTISYS